MCSKNTALDVAEQKGFKNIAEVLQQRGAKYSSGSSFHLAAKNGDIVSIEEMLNKGYEKRKKHYRDKVVRA